MKMPKMALLSSAAALLLAVGSGCGPGDAAEYMNRGATAAEAGNWPRALELASRATERAPQNADAWLLKAIAAQRSNQPVIAYDAAAQAAKLAPRSFTAQYMLGCACVEAPPRTNEAMKAFLNALKLRPNDRDTLVALCNLAAQTGDPRLGSFLYRLEKCHPDFVKSSAAFYNQQGFCALRNRRFDLALKAFGTASELAPADRRIVYNTAFVFDRFGRGRRNDEAIGLYRRYLELAENDRSADRTRRTVEARLRELERSY